ncbi:beta-galactosidase [Pseudactinotalea terrae]|uniref:beta-galactosidase n=1 Tax=Pseudactinotalea terrae TaxID=1743262 RepID=UPI001883BF25|nr:beta-galactosidase [Pseudactinotalea terrae]
MTDGWPHPRMRSRIAFGGDYNPEQWSLEKWREDIALMREAGVSMVTIGLWSWAVVEPREGVYDFDQLDTVIDLLHEAGIAIDLGTPTASPPAWFFATYPGARVVTREGVPLGFGSRGMASPSSPEYRRAAVGIAGALARRYADHPAVVLWHVHNEYGAPVGEDFSSHARAAFRGWLQDRYGSLEELNTAWGTAFWGQQYTDWEHVDLPGPTPSAPNPSQQLDFHRFTDHQLRACYLAERDAIRAHAAQPITTNFMAGSCPTTDLWAWAAEVDVVSNDHYLTAADAEPEIGLAMAADLSRSFAGGRPWLLLEHSTSGVNWQPRNVAKQPGEMRRNSLAHVARGSDSVMYFQWRASRVGAEKFHSAMLPHAGRDTRTWREVVQLGAQLDHLGEVAGTRVQADVAILWDAESHWAQRLPWRPSVGLDPEERIRTWYERLWRDGLTVDFAHPRADLSGYRLVLAPASYLLTRAAAANLTAYVKDGGTLVVGCFSAVVDEHDAVHEGGFLAPLSEVLGIQVHEYLPLREDESVTIDVAGQPVPGTVWQEAVVLTGATAVGTYRDGYAPGEPAVTRHVHGAGTAWYVSACPDMAGLAAVLAPAYRDAGLAGTDQPGVEVVTRTGAEHSFTFVINHTGQAARVPVHGHDALLGHAPVGGILAVDPGDVAVIRAAVTSLPSDRTRAAAHA